MTLLDLQEMLGFTLLSKESGYQKVQADTDHMLEVLELAIKYVELNK